MDKSQDRLRNEWSHFPQTRDVATTAATFCSYRGSILHTQSTIIVLTIAALLMTPSGSIFGLLSTYKWGFKVLLKWLTERAYRKVLPPKENSEYRELLCHLRTSLSHSYSFCICLRPFTGRRSAIWGASKGHGMALTISRRPLKRDPCSIPDLCTKCHLDKYFSCLLSV